MMDSSVLQMYISAVFLNIFRLESPKATSKDFSSSHISPAALYDPIIIKPDLLHETTLNVC